LRIVYWMVPTVRLSSSSGYAQWPVPFPLKAVFVSPFLYWFSSIPVAMWTVIEDSLCDSIFLHPFKCSHYSFLQPQHLSVILLTCNSCLVSALFCINPATYKLGTRFSIYIKSRNMKPVLKGVIISNYCSYCAFTTWWRVGLAKKSLMGITLVNGLGVVAKVHDRWCLLTSLLQRFFMRPWGRYHLCVSYDIRHWRIEDSANMSRAASVRKHMYRDLNKAKLLSE